MSNIDWVSIAKLLGQAITAGAAGFAAGGWPGAAAAAVAIILGLLQTKTSVTK